MDALLRRIPASLFREWQLFFELEPWGEERLLRPLASLEAALWNILGRPAEHKGWPTERFLCREGDMPSYDIDRFETPPVPQWKKNKEKLFAFAHAYVDAMASVKNKVFQREDTK